MSEPLPDIRIINVPNERIVELADLLADHQCKPDVEVAFNRMARGGRFQRAETRPDHQVAIYLTERHSKLEWWGGRRETVWFDVHNAVLVPMSCKAFIAHTSFHLPEDVADDVLARLDRLESGDAA